MPNQTPPCEPFLPLFEPVSRLVLEAGKTMLQADGTALEAEKKSEGNFVTAWDKAVQAQLIRGLEALAPQIPVIAEEKERQPQAKGRPVWVLDPIDGTTNFMRGYRHSAISLALVTGCQGLLAFVYNPYLDELFTARAGAGAACNGQPIRVSTVGQLSDSLIGFGTTPYDRRQADLTFRLAERLFMMSLEVRRSGSAALDLAYVAAGRLDGFFERCQQVWDYAAGALILQEAGGRINTWDLQPLSFQGPSSILATNGLIHLPMLSLIEAEEAGLG